MKSTCESVRQQYSAQYHTHTHTHQRTSENICLLSACKRAKYLPKQKWQHEIEIFCVCMLSLGFIVFTGWLFSFPLSFDLYMNGFFYRFVSFSMFGKSNATVNTFVWHKWTTTSTISKRMTTKRRKRSWRNEQKKTYKHTHTHASQLMRYREIERSMSMSMSVKSTKRKTF